MEKQIKEIIRSVVREDFMNEMSKNDVHVKEIMKFYDKGSSNAKKALSLYLLRKPNASRNQILDELGDYGYNDVWEVMDHFKLKIESVNESDLKGYLVADVVDDIVKSIGSKFVSGQIKNAPNRNYIYLKLTDIKFGSGVVKMLKSQFGIDAKIDKTFGNIPSVSFSSKKVVSESINEDKVYIDFLNKKKGFKQDRIKFNSYEDAVKWARKNFDKFSPDMIKYAEEYCKDDDISFNIHDVLLPFKEKECYDLVNNAFLLHFKIGDWNLLVWFVGVLGIIYSTGKAMLPDPKIHP